MADAETVEPPGAPGMPARWTSSAKSGVGAALTARSRIWFTISHGILNEIYYDTDMVLPEDGDWQVTIAADGPKGTGETTFTLPVLPDQGPNWALIIGGGIALVASSGLAIVWSRKQSPAPATRGRHPGHARRDR